MTAGLPVALANWQAASTFGPIEPAGKWSDVMGTWTFKIRRRGPLAASVHQDAWIRKSLLSHVVHPFAQPRGDVSMRQMVDGILINDRLLERR